MRDRKKSGLSTRNKIFTCFGTLFIILYMVPTVYMVFSSRDKPATTNIEDEFDTDFVNQMKRIHEVSKQGSQIDSEVYEDASDSSVLPSSKQKPKLPSSKADYKRPGLRHIDSLSPEESKTRENEITDWLHLTIDDSTPSLRIIILTFDRAQSLQRLLNSLVNAKYFGHRVDIDIWIDASATDGSINQETKRVADNFRWQNGQKHVHPRTFNGGLRYQWVYTWNESLANEGGLTPETNERAVILEDDLEVSPYFFMYLMVAHEEYGSKEEVAGFTLQRGTLCAARCSMKSGGPVNSGPFLYPLVGSWGFSPTAHHWYKFMNWFHNYDEYKEKPYAEGITPIDWYKGEEKAGKCPSKNCMWTVLHIYYMYTHPEHYVVYAKSALGKTLAANNREVGVNVKSRGKKDFQVIDQFDPSIFQFPHPPVRVGWNGKIKG